MTSRNVVLILIGWHAGVLPLERSLSPVRLGVSTGLNNPHIRSP